MFPLQFKQGQVVSPGTVAFVERRIESLAPDHVLVRMRASAICGSDLHIFRGLHPSAPLPVTIGHEFAGDVAAVGADVSPTWLGSRVAVEPCLPCGACDACKRGQYGHCEALRFTYRIGDGAMAPYVTVPASCLHRLPDDMSYSVGALLEPLAVAVHAVRRANVRIGQRVLVVGAGAIGLLVSALCAQCGAVCVTAVDPREDRRAMALQFGCTHAVPPGSDIPFAGQFDHAFECVGREETLSVALRALAKNGLATVMGIFEEQKISVPAGLIVARELRIQGSQGYCWDFQLACSLGNRLGIERLLTHRFPLSALQEALEACEDASRGVVKAIIEGE